MASRARCGASAIFTPSCGEAAEDRGNASAQETDRARRRRDRTAGALSSKAAGARSLDGVVNVESPMRSSTVIVALTFGIVSRGAAPADEKSIRDARRRSNAAIARHDAPGIARFWMDDIHITTSTSAHGHRCRHQPGTRMAQQFARRPDTIYVRTPPTIECSRRGPWRRSEGMGRAVGRSPTATLKVAAPTWRSGGR